VSIARTTPAQKPRGEHNNTFRDGFGSGGLGSGGFGESVVMESHPVLSAPQMWWRMDTPVKHGRDGKAKVSSRRCGEWHVEWRSAPSRLRIAQ
jgi:hypothetical protein